MAHPDWHEEILANPAKALPRDGDWQVWIDWYNRRLEGVSDPEEIELVFATVPDKEREAGPAAANKWIKERLEELQKKSCRRPNSRHKVPALIVEIDAETGAVPAKPESPTPTGSIISRGSTRIIAQIVHLAGELLANLGEIEQP